MKEKMSQINIILLLGMGFLLAIMPIGQTPHLVEKLEMLSQGNLTKPIDIFDLIMHGGAPIVALYLIYKKRKENDPSE